MRKVKYFILRGVRLSEPGYAITGIFGFIGYPLFYFIWTSFGYQESFPYRVFCTAVCMGLAFPNMWPKKLKPYSAYYWYFFLIFCIKGFFTYSLLLNDFNLVWLLSFTCSLFILGQFIDWINYLLISAIGDSFAVALFLANHGQFNIPSNYIELIVIYGFINSSCLVLNFRSMFLKIQKWQTLRFISAKISHEIGTPVASVSVIGSSLVDLLDDPDMSYPEIRVVLKENLLKIASQAEHIKTIIDIMLYNAGRGNIDRRKFLTVSIAECIEEAVEKYPYIKHNLNQKIRVVLMDNFLLDTNKYLFINLLFNLIKNSIAAINRKGEGDIIITAQAGPKWNTLTVRDTGDGIPDNIKPAIFDELTSTYQDETNVGLGLSFVKSLITAMKGNISVNSKYGRFTEIILHIPKIV